MPEVLRLTDHDIEALDLDYADIVSALRAGFCQLDDESSIITPKVSARGVKKGFHHAMPAIFEDLALVKWVSSGSEPKGAYLYATAIVNDRTTGAPIAFLDFNRATGLRTAAVSALGADILAAPGARSVSVVGLGLQARCHIDALRAVRPIERVVAWGRSSESCESFARYAESRGLDIVTTTEASDAFYDSDIVVSALPLRTLPFLDARRLRAGGMIVAVDLANAWTVDGLRDLDHLSTDNRFHLVGTMQSHSADFHDLFYDDDLTSLLKRGHVWKADRRVAFIPPGMAYCDAILAKLILEAASARH